MSAALTTNVDQRQLRMTKFPPEFNAKVDLKKVNVQLIKSWIAEEIERILGTEDDVLVELVNQNLERSRYPNIKELQINVTGFLNEHTASFCQALWKLCLSAQDSPHGVPKELIEAKKAELAQAKADEDRAREATAKRAEAERERDRDMARIRDRERNDRGRDRGGRGGRDFDWRGPRDSRSPPPRRRRDDDFRRQSGRGTDSYIPGNARRRRSPSDARSPSRAPSPPRRRRRSRSRSRSLAPRESPNTSSERSRSRDRGYHRRPRRSPSPNRRRRRHNDRRDRTRSPPPPAKRTRRSSLSPSPSQPRPSTSDSSAPPPSPSPKIKKGAALSPDDLMSSNRRAEKAGRLSQESEQNRSRPLYTDRDVRERNVLRERALKAALTARKNLRFRE